MPVIIQNTRPTISSSVHSGTYRPDIDGLRALAVLSVLLFHAKLGFPGGFVGVDIFFVISGYLISSLIFKDISNRDFSLISFWERRILRILPALAVVVLFTLVASWFLYLPDDFDSVGRSTIAQGFSLSNVFFYLQRASYFDSGLDTKPLLHTWSLGVEEQFYLLLPLLLIFLSNKGKATIRNFITGIALCSFLLSVYGTYSHSVATFYLLPTRAWELLLGTLLAMSRKRFMVNAITREILGWLGLALVCQSIFFYSEDTRFPGLAAVLPCSGAALIIFSSESGLSFVGQSLSLKPIVFIGVISYSLYLWHWPLLAFSHYMAKGPQSVGTRIVLLLVSLALATLSWKYVETPFRKRWIIRKRMYVFGLAGSLATAFVAFGLLIAWKHGFPSRVSPEVLAYATRAPSPFIHDVPLSRALSGEFPQIGTATTNQPIDLLIWGDSHAMSVTPALDELCHRFSRNGVQATYSATAPILGFVSNGPYSLGKDAPLFANAVLDFIRTKHIKNVVIAAYWSHYASSETFETQLISTIRAIINTGARVYILQDYPNPGFDVPRVVAVTAMQQGNLELLGLDLQGYTSVNRELQPVFKKIASMGAIVLKPSQFFLNRNGIYGVVKNNRVLYRDGEHLTVEGAKLLIPLFEPIFTKPGITVFESQNGAKQVPLTASQHQ